MNSFNLQGVDKFTIETYSSHVSVLARSTDRLVRAKTNEAEGSLTFKSSDQEKPSAEDQQIGRNFPGAGYLNVRLCSLMFA